MSKKKAAPGTEPEAKEIQLPTGEQTPPQTIKAKIIPINIYTPLITYLKSKPMTEVEGLVNVLNQQAEGEFTITNAPQGN